MLRPIIGFLILMAIFTIIERVFVLRREQKIFRKGWFCDLFHYFVNPILLHIGVLVGGVLLYISFHRLLHNNLQIAIGAQPLWLQFIEAYIIGEVIFYFIHRAAHVIPWLWKFHAIHHSSEQMDWLASVRLHPMEQVITELGIGVPLALLGFHFSSFGFVVIFRTFLAILNHANVRINFGFFTWLVGSPRYHHWHHANQTVAYNKNFGHPLIDWLFGTYYLPQKEWPLAYGVDEYIPINYLQHLLYPFQRAKVLKY